MLFRSIPCGAIRGAAAVLLLAAAAASGDGLQQCLPPPAAIVAWYTADSGGGDIKGHHNALPGCVPGGAGEVGTAFFFDGGGCYVQIADFQDLHQPSITVDAWIELNVVETGLRTFISKPLGSGTYESFGLSVNNGVLSGSASVADGNGITLNSNVTLSAHTWYHAALTVDSAHLATLYLNGQAVASGNLGGAVGYDGSTLQFGANKRSGVVGGFVRGEVDEVQFMDRALSATEILDIYQAGSVGQCKDMEFTSGPVCTASPPGLQAWFKADGNALDSQGGNLATLMNGTSYMTGEDGAAFSFNDASSQYVSIADAPAMKPASFTVEGWFALGDFPAPASLVSKPFATGTAHSYQLLYNSGEIQAVVGTTDGAQTLLHSAFAPSANAWAHYALTYDATSRQARLYVNGALVGSQSTPVSAVAYDSHPVLLGADYGDGSYSGFYKGGADEVSVYNRALTATEIATIYKSFGLGKCTACMVLQNPPLAWYKGEGNASDSGGVHPATVHGGVSFAPGIVGKAFTLNGVDGYVSVPDTANLHPGSLTADAWFKLDQAPSGANHFIAKEVGGGSKDSFAIWLEGGNLNGTECSAASCATLSYPFAPAIGAWHHAALTVDSVAQVQTLYLDGVAVATGGTVPVGYDASPILIGADNQGAGPADFFPGQIDEARLFAYALSSREVNGVYCAGGRGTCAVQFTPVTGAELATPYTSNAITLTGLASANQAVSISGGQYSKNGGSFTSASGLASNGDTLVVKLTSAFAYSTKVTAQLSFGSGAIKKTFNVVTRAVDATPSAFTFAPVTNAALSTVYTSNAITVGGMDNGAVAPLSVSGGQYSLNGGGWSSAAATAHNGDTVALQVTSSANPATTVGATLTIGSVHGVYNVRTRPADLTPDAFGFSAVTGASLSTAYVSDTVTISGLDAGHAAPITINAGQYSINGGAWTSAAGTIANGDTLRVQVISSSRPGVRVTATVHISSVSGAFSVTTM